MISDQNFVKWFFHISSSENSHCFSSEEVVQLQGKRCVVHFQKDRPGESGLTGYLKVTLVQMVFT